MESGERDKARRSGFRKSAEKARIAAELDAKTPEEHLAESRPLNRRERAVWKEIQRAIKKKAGRPKIGRGVKVISLSVERTLLKEADAYAKRRGLKRAQLFAEGVRTLLKNAF